MDIRLFWVVTLLFWVDSSLPKVDIRLFWVVTPLFWVDSKADSFFLPLRGCFALCTDGSRKVLAFRLLRSPWGRGFRGW